MLRLSFLATLLVLLIAPATVQGQAFSDESLDAPEWQPFEEAMGQAAETEQTVMVDIYAEWCNWCRRLEEEVYADTQVRNYLRENFAVTRLDFDDSESEVTFQNEPFAVPEMAYLLGAQGVPTVAFLSHEGEYITHLPGFVERDDFLDVLRFVATEAYKDQTWEEFVSVPE